MCKTFIRSKQTYDGRARDEQDRAPPLWELTICKGEEKLCVSCITYSVPGTVLSPLH